MARVEAEALELVVACDDLERPRDGGVSLLSALDKWILGPPTRFNLWASRYKIGS